MQIKNPHSTLTLRLPRLVYVDDYHEFKTLEQNIRIATGIEDIQVTEIGFDEYDSCEYVGLVHIERSSHDKIGNERIFQAVTKKSSPMKNNQLLKFKTKPFCFCFL